MGCATGLARTLFFFFNFIFWVLGIAVLGIGIYSRVQNDSWKDLLKTSSLFTAANLLIAAGVLVAIIGFLGCCGALKKVQCMLMMYAILVILIFLLEIAAGAYAYTKKETVQTELTDQLDKGVAKVYGKDDSASKGMTKAIDWFQENVKCCGASGPDSWNTSHWNTIKTGNAKVPKSCCKTQSAGCNEDLKKVFAKGCVQAGKDFAKKHLWIIGGVGIGIGVVELLGVIFSLCLWKAFRDDEKGTSA